MKKNIIREKTFVFGKRIVRLCIYLEKNKSEYILSKQLKRSGTAPGALVRESEHAESKKDFVHKLSIALKEANETEYWLQMIKEGDYLSEQEFSSIHNDCLEIIKILVAIVKTSKSKLNG
ncbi:MAG: four helix bundle protein [Bacteroidota bacterium]